MVEEHLKNLKLYYRVFLLLCFAYLVFALPTSEVEKYTEAIEELKKLHEILKNELDKVPNRLTNSYENDAAHFSNAFERNPLTSKIKITTSNKYIHSTFGSKEALKNMRSLEGIYKFFRRNEQFNEFQSRKDTLPAALLEWISKSEKRMVEFENAKSFELKKLTFTRLPMDDGSEDYVPKYANMTAKGEMVVKPNRYWPDYETTLDGYIIEMVVSGGIQDYVDLQYKFYPKYLLKSTKLFKRIDTGSGNYDILFPKLRPLWNELKDMDIASAIDHLDAKIYQTRQANDLSIFGINVDKRIGTIVGPVAVFLTMLFLFIQLRQIQWLHSHEVFDITGLSWIPLYPGKLSLVIGIGSLVFLPIVAGFTLTLHLSETRMWDYIGMAFFLIAACLGLCCIKLSGTLKNSMAKPNKANSADAKGRAAD